MKNTLKRASALIVALLVSSLCFVGSFAEEALSAAISAVDANVGETFEVRITLGTNDGILSGSFNVVYDRDKTELVSAVSDTDMMNGVLYVINDKYTDNSVRISFASNAVFGYDGGDMMVLTFKAISAGTASFGVEKLKLASDGKVYVTADSSATVMLYGSAISTPSTVKTTAAEKTTDQSENSTTESANYSAAATSAQPSDRVTSVQDVTAVPVTASDSGAGTTEKIYTLYIDQYEVSQYEMFDVEIKIKGNYGLSSGSFNVVYDNEALRFVSYDTETDFAADCGILNVVNGAYKNNTVRSSFAANKADGQPVSGVLLKIRFQAIKEGKTSISIENAKISDNTYAFANTAANGNTVVIGEAISGATIYEPTVSATKISETRKSGGGIWFLAGGAAVLVIIVVLLVVLTKKKGGNE